MDWNAWSGWQKPISYHVTGWCDGVERCCHSNRKSCHSHHMCYKWWQFSKKHYIWWKLIVTIKYFQSGRIISITRIKKKYGTGFLGGVIVKLGDFSLLAVFEWRGLDTENIHVRTYEIWVPQISKIGSIPCGWAIIMKSLW